MYIYHSLEQDNDRSTVETSFFLPDTICADHKKKKKGGEGHNIIEELIMVPCMQS